VIDPKADPHADPYAKVHHYSVNTWLGTLWTHLLKYHLEDWVLECQQQNIVLRGKEGEETHATFTGHPLQHQAKAWIPFSQEAFDHTLVQFTVATDQLNFYFI
jgi:hypothetical protein